MDATAPTEEVMFDEQVEQGADEDQSLDTLEDALDALVDDDGQDGEPEAEADVEPDADEDDSVLVTLDGEDKVSLKELKAGYFRQKDYTLKTTEVAQERKAIEATKAGLTERTSVLETALQNLSGYLERLIPPDPPLQLAQTDPGRFQYQRALRESAIAELTQLVTIRGAVDQQKQSMTAAELREYREAEQSRLVKAMPELADPVKRIAFDQSVKSAAKSFGFSDEEIDATSDSRILQMVHFARIGKRAVENKQNALKRVETPRAAKVKSATPPVNVENKKAMHALSKSGSIKDAMRIDFD
jgi:hypothetical protein